MSEQGERRGPLDALPGVPCEGSEADEVSLGARDGLPAVLDCWQVMMDGPVGLCVVSADGMVLEANMSLCDFLGRDRESLRGLSWVDLTDPDDATVGRVPFDEIAAGRSDRYQQSQRFRFVDGSVRHGELAVTAVRDADGDVECFIAQVMDTTARAVARDSETIAAAQFRRLAEESSDIVTVVDRDGLIEWVSPSVTAALGWTVADYTGKQVTDVIHPDDVAKVADIVARADAGDQTARVRHRSERADGSYKWFDSVVIVARDDSGSSTRAIVTSRDVHAEVEAQERLEESEHRFRLLAENASHVVFRSRGNLLHWVSPSSLDVLGYDPADLIGSDPLDLVHPDDRDRVADSSAARAPGETSRVRCRMRRGDGSYRWFETRAKVSGDPDTPVLTTVAEVHDVHDEVIARAAVEEARDRQHAILDSLLDPWILLAAVRDQNGRIVDFEYLDGNRAACQANRLTLEQMIGQTLLTFFPAHATNGSLDAYATVVETGEPLSVDDIPFRGADGEMGWFDNRAVKVGDGLSFTWRDVTERRKAEESLAASEELMRVVLDASGDAVLRFDRDLRVDYVNRRTVELSGIPAEDWIGATTEELPYPVDFARIIDEHCRRVLETGTPVTHEFEIFVAEGRRWHEAIHSPSFDRDGSVAQVIVTSRDITARKAAELALKELATHDPLTGLSNRAVVLEEVNRAMHASRRTGRSAAVLMIDLDHFKDVNDTLGHGVGDELLVAAAARLQGSARGGDLVARLGGDEFVVVLRELNDPADAVRAAWRLAQDFRDPFATPTGGDLYATVSVGVAIATEASMPDGLIREADTAMYAAKVAGRDRVSVFNDDVRNSLAARLAIENDLRPALERDELVLWFQPEVDLTTGMITAVEALLRWNHPDGSVWSADRFIDVAEDTGLIIPIGDWVLAQACAQGATWAAARPDRPITMRVNTSARQLAHNRLLPAVDAALAGSGLKPALLCVEITEAALLRLNTIAHQNLNGIRDRGIRIAIDDFGTGYAALAYLHQYPIDVIKNDRSFITHLATHDEDRNLVAGMIALGHSLDISVTAGGVENEDQASVLRELGCPAAQGYLYSHPVPPEQLTTLLDEIFPHS